jgi:acetyl-CoA C-acetyltransferase
VPAHVAATAVGRCGRRPESLVDLLTEVGTRALETVDASTVDFLAIGNMAASVLGENENLVGRMADRLGLDGASAVRAEAASASGAAVFHVACAQVLSGRSRRALVLAGEKMTDRPTAEVARVLARSLAPEEQAAGATMPGLAALVAQLYLAEHRREETVFDTVSVRARAAAARNPAAQFRAAVTAEDVRISRPIALPLRLLHCAAIADGAAAIVLDAGVGPATVLGLGQGIDRLRVTDRRELSHFAATREAARRAYEEAKLTRKEVAFAELHDAFAPFALIDLEDIGVCGPGEAADWFARGWTAPDGRFPVNVSGGLLGRGHPVGASGLLQIAEVARQLKGEAGEMQLPERPRVGLAQSIGGLASHNFVTILGNASRS